MVTHKNILYLKFLSILLETNIIGKERIILEIKILEKSGFISL
jgi:hypothetical protein